MKKVFSKELWKKFLVAIMVIISCMWVAPEKVHADDGWGGKLAEPVADLLIFIGDATVKLSHVFILGEDNSETLIRSDKSKSFWSIAAGIAVGVLIAAAAIGIAIVTCGATAVIAAVLGGSIIVTTVTAVAVVSRSVCWCYGI